MTGDKNKQFAFESTATQCDGGGAPAAVKNTTRWYRSIGLATPYGGHLENSAKKRISIASAKSSRGARVNSKFFPNDFAIY